MFQLKLDIAYLQFNRRNTFNKPEEISMQMDEVSLEILNDMVKENNKIEKALSENIIKIKGLKRLINARKARTQKNCEAAAAAELQERIDNGEAAAAELQRPIDSGEETERFDENEFET